jgi:hypothetical protein
MDFSVDTRLLAETPDQFQEAVGKKSTIPILSHVLIEASPEGLRLAAPDPACRQAGWKRASARFIQGRSRPRTTLRWSRRMGPGCCLQRPIRISIVCPSSFVISHSPCILFPAPYRPSLLAHSVSHLAAGKNRSARGASKGRMTNDKGQRRTDNHNTESSQPGLVGRRGDYESRLGRNHPLFMRKIEGLGATQERQRLPQICAKFRKRCGLLASSRGDVRARLSPFLRLVTL